MIAEAKRRSPSGGEIAPALEPGVFATACAAAGARALSVLTEGPHFGGSVGDLATVAARVSVPVLRKDFILDELQLLEARAAGAAAVLLIVRALSGTELATLNRVARSYDLGTLVEVHDRAELDCVLELDPLPTAVGINARDLATFSLDRRVVEGLLGRVPPDRIAVAESGIEGRAEVEQLAQLGADAVLVGTAIARSPDPAAAVRALVGVERHGR